MKQKTKKISVFILVITMFLSVLLPCANAYGVEEITDWTIKLYNDENGLPTAEANAVLCASDGYIWIGSYGGLLRFNGNSFVNFSSLEDGIPVYSIRSLYEAKDGILYIGTSEGVYTWNGKTFHHIDAEGQTEITSVYCFAEDSKGNVYAGTADGLFVIGENNIAVSADPDNSLYGTIYSICCADNDVIWGTDLNGALFAIKNGKVLYYDYFNGDPTESYYCVTTVYSAGEQVLAAGTSLNHAQIIRVSGTDEEPVLNFDTINTREVHSINKMYFDGDNTIWIAGVSGAGKIELNSRTFTTDGELLDCTSLNCITVDYESNIWMSSSNYGVFEVSKGSVYHPVEAKELQSESVTSITQCNSSFYVGTSNGLFVLNRDFEIVESNIEKELENAYIRNVMTDSDELVWISSYNNEYGLRCFNPKTGEIDSFGYEQGILTNQFRSTIELSDGRIAAATAYGVYIINKETKMAEEHYSEEEGLTGTLILSLTQTPDGLLYIATDNKGLFCLEDGAIREVDGTLGSILRTRWDEQLNGMWISNSSSLWFMDSSENIEQITSFDEGVGSIFDIIISGDELFLMKSSGIYRINKQALLNEEDPYFRVYDSAESFSGSCVSNSWSYINDERLFVCSTKGLYIINVNESQPERVLPKVAIDKVVYKDLQGEHTLMSYPDEIDLTQDCERLTIYFSCLHYNKHDYNVMYYLDGFGEEIRTISASEEGVATYTNLSGGEYTFRVFSGDKYNNYGEQEDISIAKEYKLSEKAWFRVVAVLSILAFAVLVSIIVVKFRLKKIGEEKERYRNITTQALETIAHTIDAKDKYTNGHSIRVAEYSREIGKRLGLEGEKLENLYYVALLHDIGKIGVPDNILNKSGKLTDEEFSVMRDHTKIGGEILKDFNLIEGISQGAVGHHERYDGKGYPNHLPGEENTFFARIISVADAYDAMASDRPYRKHLSRDYIMGELEKGKGTQFDPKATDAMLEYLNSLPPEDLHT